MFDPSYERDRASGEEREGCERGVRGKRKKTKAEEGVDEGTEREMEGGGGSETRTEARQVKGERRQGKRGSEREGGEGEGAHGLRRSLSYY